ncbi:MAG: hypothetical protein WCJ92_05520 [Alphaproteobacteria bacterium]
METQELIKLAAIFGLVVFLLNLSPAIKRNTKKLGKLKHIKMKKYKMWKGQRKRVKS